jgi:hypothetical protein
MLSMQATESAMRGARRECPAIALMHGLPVLARLMHASIAMGDTLSHSHLRFHGLR